MKYIFLGIFVVVALFSGTPAHAATEPSETFTGPLRDATVNLYCRLKSGRTYFGITGSGVVIDSRGVILTNAHVAQYFLLASEKGTVSGKCYVRTGSPARDHYTASVLYLPPKWIDANKEGLKKKKLQGTGERDFALLYITGAVEGQLPLWFSSLTPAFYDAPEGTAVTVAGYPSDNLDFRQMRNKLTILAATSTVTSTRSFSEGTTDVLTLAPSSAGKPGVSGGPVVNAENVLLGIAVARNDSTLRIITLPYIQRTFMSETGTLLPVALLGDLAANARTWRQTLTPEQVAAIRYPIVRGGR